MSIIVGMVTYCLGSARQKREYFKKKEGAVILDNIEVIFCVSENGRNYFAYGDVPFSGFTAEEYLRYRRALCGGTPPVQLLPRFGIKPEKRLKKLTPAELRCLMFLEKTCGFTDKPVVINLDGTKYSLRNQKALKRLIEVCPDAYVLVTDNRFFKRAPFGRKTLVFGKPVKKKRPAFYTAKLFAAKLNAKKVSVM